MAATGINNQGNWKIEATLSFTISNSSGNPPLVSLTGSSSPDSDQSGSSGRQCRTTHPKVMRPPSQAPPLASSNGVGFSFVNVAHPNDARGSVNKRAIRSHVAKVQHSKTRASNIAAKDTTDTRAQRRTLQPRIKAEAGMLQIKHEPRQDSAFASRDQSDDPEELDRRSRHDSHDNGSSSLANTSVLNLVRILRGGRHDPFWTYPVPYNVNMERIIDHYLVTIAVDVPFVVPTDQPGLLVKKWMPLCMSDPSIFYAVALMGASHYAVTNPATASAFNLLSLRGKAIAAINEALSDPIRSRSDGALGAVMKMAAYESVFGDEHHFHAHMAGLQQMVRMRGGLPELGMDGLLERSILWIDSNASHHLGCGWKFDKKWFPTTLVHPVPDGVQSSEQAGCSTWELANNPPLTMSAGCTTDTT